MKRISIGHVVRVTIPVALLVVVSSVVAASAQGNSPFDQILAKLDEIIGVLTTPPPNAEVTLATSVVVVGPSQSIFCNAANVGSENVEGVFKVLGSFGEVAEVPVTLSPGENESVFEAVLGGGVFRRCEFMFVGTASSVRGNMLVINDVGGGDTAAVVEMR